MSIGAIEDYLAVGYPNIQGWVSPYILRIVGHFSEEMAKFGVEGGACEIGVHHGKFIIGLTNVVQNDRNLAIDIFDNQHFNIDHSGGGEQILATFRDNVQKYSRYKISELNIDSLAITPEHRRGIAAEFGPFKFFSVDGGHEATHVVNDYFVAEELTHPGGTIIIDDINNSSWPGVMEGVFKLFFCSQPKFVPFIFGHNKLFLAHLSYHRLYLPLVLERLNSEIKEAKFVLKRLFGHDLICF